MGKTRDIQGAGILLAPNWKLFPTDARNWELCELTDKGWMHRGRFYQYNTIDEALLYVADELMRQRAYARHIELGSALVEYRDIAESIRATARALS